MSNRITEVRLLSVPLEKDCEHTWYFDTPQKQYEAMNSHLVEGNVNFSYQRKDNVIRYPQHFDKISACNYVMYKNSAYTNKWYYAFITDMKYVNDERTDITIETDVLQTYMFDYSLGQCFIERQHVDDDTVGLHTIPEGLETGEYVVNSVTKAPHFESAFTILATTVDFKIVDSDWDGDWRFKAPKLYGKYNNVYSGLKYYAFHNLMDDEMSEGHSAPDLDDLSQILYLCATASQSDAIVSIFTVPGDLINYNAINEFNIHSTEGADENYSINMCEIEYSSKNKTSPWNDFDKPTSLNGYTPYNNKLLTHPFTYLFIDNNAGGGNIYKYEYFKPTSNGEHDIQFWLSGAIVPGFSCRLIPHNYKGMSGNNNSEGLTAGKLPICNWATDVYTNWLTQQGINERYDFLSHVLGQGSQVGAGASMFGGPGALSQGIEWTGSGISKIFDNVKQREIHKQIPPTLNGNINAGDVNFGNGNSGFTAYDMSIKKEYAEIIDMYFNMYGYQVNVVDRPHKKHRLHYWYTKTSGANILQKVGSVQGINIIPIPQNDLAKIKAIYDNGVTFWREESFLDYSLINSIVTEEEYDEY